MKPNLKPMLLAAALAATSWIGLPPAVAGTNDLPWNEAFENYAPGQSLDGTNGWSVLSPLGGAVVTNLTYTFTNSALALRSTNHTAVLDRSEDVAINVTAAAATNVYCDMMIYAGQRRNLTTNAFDASARTAFGVDTNGQLNVWHQTDTNADGIPDGPAWSVMAHPALATDAWARVTLAMDNTTDKVRNYQYVQVRLNGFTLTNADAFARPDGSLQAGGSWFIMGGVGGQAVSNVEFNGYGKSDDVVLQYTEPWPSPVASNDTETVVEGVPTRLSPLTNDSDPAGDAISLLSVGAAGHGTTTTTGVNQVRYTATVGYVGPDAFTYTIMDAYGATATGTVNVTVQTRPPVTVNDTVTVKEGVPATISPLANDSDPAGDAISLVSVTQPAHGTSATAAGNQVLYTATAGYVGADSFTYTITDAFGAQATAAVNVTVQTRPPVAVDDSVSVLEVVPTLISPLANDSDPAGDAISLLSLTQPAHGTAVDAGGNQVLYTGASGYVGSDTFTYTIVDAYGAQATATVNVSVLNQPPVAVNDAYTVTQGIASVLAPLANDSDPAGDAITLFSFGQPSHGVTTASGGNGVQYVAAPSYTGTDTFQYVIADVQGAQATGTVTLTVRPYLTNPLPWRESFEPYAPGLNLVGTNGWSGPGDPIVTALTYPYAYPAALPLAGLTHTQILNRADTVSVQVTAVPGTNVYCDMMLCAGYRRNLSTLVLDTDARAAVGLDTNGIVNVWHETDTDGNGNRDGAKWTPLGNAPLASNAWIRVTLIMDNTSDTVLHYRYVKVCLDEVPMTSGEAYARPNGALQPGGPWFIMAGNGTQSIQSVELNGYGYSDDMVIDYGAPRFAGGSVFMFR